MRTKKLDKDVIQVDANAEDPAVAEDPRPGEAVPVGAPKNPLAGKANIRLAHTAAGSPERAMFEAEHDDWYPALSHWRTDGVEYELPTTPDGKPDVALQRKGWHDPYAHRIVRASPHYVLITEKGA